MLTGPIPTAAAYPRVQRDALFTRVTTQPPRVQNSPTPLIALVLDYPQTTENNTPEAPAYNMRGRAAQKCSISQELMFQEVNISNHRLDPSNISQIKLPLKVLCNMTNTVLEGDTGDLLEY